MRELLSVCVQCSLVLMAAVGVVMGHIVLCCVVCLPVRSLAIPFGRNLLCSRATTMGKRARDNCLLARGCLQTSARGRLAKVRRLHSIVR